MPPDPPACPKCYGDDPECCRELSRLDAYMEEQETLARDRMSPIFAGLAEEILRRLGDKGRVVVVSTPVLPGLMDRLPSAKPRKE